MQMKFSNKAGRSVAIVLGWLINISAWVWYIFFGGSADVLLIAMAMYFILYLIWIKFFEKLEDPPIWRGSDLPGGKDGA